MPYIPEDERAHLDSAIDELVNAIRVIIEDKGLDIRDTDGRLNLSLIHI